MALYKIFLTPTIDLYKKNTKISNLLIKRRENSIQCHTYNINEIKLIMFYSSNSSIDPDRILLQVIKMAWPIYKEEIIDLFHHSLEEGYHLCIFQNDILCALPKPENCSYFLPQSYHFIKLILCFRKVLE